MDNSWSCYRSLLLKALLFSMFLLFLFSCSTGTVPKNGNDEFLLVFSAENHLDRKIVLQFSVGKKRERHTLRPGEKGDFLFVLEEGERVTLQEQPEWGLETKVLPANPDCLTLYPESLMITPEGATFRNITPEEKKTLSHELISRYNFYLWSYLTPVNFHPYLPRRFHSEEYSLDIDTGVPLEIWIDGIHWGTSPLTASLSPGKHQLICREEGQEIFTTFLNVEENDRFQQDLQQYTRTAKEGKEWSLVLENFQNGGQENESYLAPLIKDALNNALSEIPRLQVIPGEEEGLQIATEQGSEMLIKGFYLVEKESLILHTSLIDVRTGQVFTADFSHTELGLDILRSIESIAAEISASVTRILPEPGEAFYLVSDDFSESMVPLEMALALEEAAAVRLSYPNDLSFGLYVPYTDTYFVYSDGSENRLTISPLALSLAYGRSHGSRLRSSLSLELMMAPVGGIVGYKGVGFEAPPFNTENSVLLYQGSYSSEFLLTSNQNSYHFIGPGIQVLYTTVEEFTSLYLFPNIGYGYRKYYGSHLGEKQSFWEAGFQYPLASIELIGMSNDQGTPDENISDHQYYSHLNFYVRFGRSF